MRDEQAPEQAAAICSERTDAAADGGRDVLVYGDRDVRAPLTVAEALHGAISGSRLVVLPEAGHVCNVGSSQRVNYAVRDFLHEVRS